MKRYREQQIEIFKSLADDDRLTHSAKRQVAIFISLLEKDPKLGFDTTSALFYGFLQNEEFTDPSVCPLNARQLSKAKEISRCEAARDTAHETALLTRVARLPLDKVLGGKMDLKDLALSFLTYASDEPYFYYSFERNRRLYEYLDIPKNYYLNVYNLRNDLKKIGMTIDDFVVNLSRLRSRLWVPDTRFVSIEFSRIIDTISANLPEALFHLNGEALENLTMELFDRAGYNVAKIGRRVNEGDGGIDVIAYSQDSLAGDLRMAIQCKATKNRIQPRAIREFNTSLQNFKSHKGIFITTSDFTSGVKSEVNEIGYSIELMDYMKLSNKVRGAIVKS